MIEFAITAFCLGVQPEQGAWDEFVAATRRSIPDHGSLFLEYESDASSAVLLLGADIGSGAWYKIAFYPNQPNDLRFSKSVGREPSGAGFRGLVSDGEVPVWKVEPAALSDAAVDEFIPLVAVKALPSLGENVVAVETDSAGWRLRFKLGNGMRQFVEGWLPNFFGAQRFGRGAENIADGRALLRDERRVTDRFRRRFLLSAFQAGLFNRYLAARMAEGLLHRVIAGEVLQRTQTGGLFTCALDEMVAAQVRLERREIVPTGPMFGHKMFMPAPDSVAAAREQAILDEEGVRPDDFAPFAKIAEGTRRALLVRIEAPTLKQEDDRLVIAFALPSGSYATVLLDEIMKSEGATDAIAGRANAD